MTKADVHSQGCRYCQQGAWLCIYLTYLCNGGCIFCPAPRKNEDVINSAFGVDPKQILSYLNEYDFKGISFSGGDCFLVFDRLKEWLLFFRHHRPDIYYWAYTNGLDVTRAQLKDIAKIGLNEIRFNIAASGYNHPAVLENISIAAKIFEHVAVEIPSIPKDYTKVIAVVPVLEQFGVRYLNLHELIYPAECTRPIEKRTATLTLNYDMNITYDTESRSNTQNIRKYCHDHGFQIGINDCSLQQKEEQMKQRRLAMGRIFKQDYEQLDDDGLLTTVAIILQDKSHYLLRNFDTIEECASSVLHHCFHPDLIHLRKASESEHLIKLTFLPQIIK